MNLEQLGWNERFEQEFIPYKNQHFSVGRITLEHKRLYRIVYTEGELLAEVSGKFRFEAHEREHFPAVGDWVVMTPRPAEGKATIHAVLPRFSKFSRKTAGARTEEQIVATNVNTVFLVNALNNDFNVRRLERYLMMSWESGATPVIILSKADLCTDIETKRAKVEAIAYGVPIHVVSTKTNEGLESLYQYVTSGQTIALLGSSGAGKSTLSNFLAKSEKQVVQEVRAGDDRGKHTTTHRELMILPRGGLIIDTPGMRELQLWESEQSSDQVFQDIQQLEQQCRFRNCTHTTEPHCAVNTSLETGELLQERFDRFKSYKRNLLI